MTTSVGSNPTSGTKKENKMKQVKDDPETPEIDKGAYGFPENYVYVLISIIITVISLYIVCIK